MKINYIDFGIAFKINDQVYLNKQLDKYPKLKEALINHENAHTDTYEFGDLKIDLFGKYLKGVKKDYYKFLFKEKKAWYQILPFIKLNNKLHIDPIMSLFWILVLIETYLIISMF